MMSGGSWHRYFEGDSVTPFETDADYEEYLGARPCRFIVVKGRPIRRMRLDELLALDEDVEHDGGTGGEVDAVPRVVGFQNHWDGIRRAICDLCMRIVIVSKHLDPNTPLPDGCVCRAIRPAGHEVDLVFVPKTTSNLFFEDLNRDGGILWSTDDWHIMVCLSLYRAANRKMFSEILPFVGMLQYALIRLDVVIDENVFRILKTYHCGESKDEILFFIRSGIRQAGNFMLGPFDPEADRKVSVREMNNSVLALTRGPMDL
jgi:hypothetical protein